MINRDTATIIRSTNPAVLTIAGSFRSSILKTLAYFDIFHYPLNREEILRFSDTRLPESRLDLLLEELITHQIIFRHQDFYSLQSNALLAHRRIEGNHRAGQMLVKARKIGRFLYRFPFVRAVGVSGSLSKNFADDKADIDFFIITKANRLWIARTIMHLFKKNELFIRQAAFLLHELLYR